MGNRRQNFIPDDVAQKMATRAWVGTYFPARAHVIDEDEPLDPVELAGSSVVVLTGIYTVEWPGKCTIACYFPTVACGTCPHGKVKSKKIREPEEKFDLAGVQVFLLKFTLHLPPKKVEPAFQSRNDACFDQYALASNCRGSRGRAELRVSGRMGL